jgi:hypothetical protein
MTLWRRTRILRGFAGRREAVLTPAEATLLIEISSLRAAALHPGVVF